MARANPPGAGLLLSPDRPSVHILAPHPTAGAGEDGA
jgi:hypothetical protein